jgi:putative heme degradation protein
MHGMMKGNKDKKKSWSVKTEKDGVCTSIEVREVSNGFIICKTKYGSKEDGEYFSEQEEWISTENPLADDEKEEKEEKGPIDSLKGIFNNLGGGDSMY